MENNKTPVYDFKKMLAFVDGKTLPMRVDTESGMIDMWNEEIQDFCWSTSATIAFKKLSEHLL